VPIFLGGYACGLLWRAFWDKFALPTTFLFNQELDMTVAKVIELSSSSKKSFDDAVAQGIARASETIADIQGAWVQEQKVVVSKGKIVEYRVNMKVTFVLAGAKKK
jgi:dodecin